MANPSTLYRFRILIPNQKVEIDVRVPMHPSETEIFLVTRVLAYALNYEEGLEFSQGLSTPDDPAIRLLEPHGQIQKWIDIGNPSARRLHKASKAAKSVMIYTYKDVENLRKEASKEKIYNADKIQVYAFDGEFLQSLSEQLERNNEWKIDYIPRTQEITVAIGGELIEGKLTHHRL
jgi:uncharacterized protein YaeQ